MVNKIPIVKQIFFIVTINYTSETSLVHQGKQLDTELLKTFLEVQKTRHFGKAAENLYLTQSAVSFRIRQLEQSLGVPLFIRFRNNIQLTAAGELLLPHAEAVLTAIGAARQQIQQQIQPHQSRQLIVAHELSVLFNQPWLTDLMPTDTHWQLDFLPHRLLARQDFSEVDGVLSAGPVLAAHPLGAGQFIGALELWPVRPPTVAIKAEVALQLSQAVPRLSTLPLQMCSADPDVVLQWLVQQPSCGYLPALLVKPLIAQGQLILLESAKLKIPVYAYGRADDSWPLAWQQLLQRHSALVSDL
jgi:DNA-binding transcriptional LysR family regulator